ncbi:MAG TPA: D-aminoacylase [Thermoplasmata archaeon]
MHSIVITGGTLFDGTGDPAKPVDLTIDGSRISGIKKRGDARGSINIDASDMIVCPGFVDIHTHSDISLLGNPQAHSKIMQGVTTELVGNCGSSAAPLGGTAKDSFLDYARELCIDINWTSMDEYLLRLQDLRVSVNVATLVGAETVRRCVIGEADRKADFEELQAMKRLVAESMLQGAFGLSSGLIYAPGMYASTEELIELAGVASSLGGFYASHIRGEGRTLEEAVSEAIRIGRESNIRVEISHHKACGRPNWGKVKRTIQMIDTARTEGIDVGFDVYPYTASCTSLDTILPPWAREGGKEDIMRRIRDPELRRRIVSELEIPSEDWENSVPDTGWENIVAIDIKKGENKRYDNRPISEIARMMGKEPAEAAMDLMADEQLTVSAVFHDMTEEDVETVLSHPLSCIGSDGSSVSPYGPMGESGLHPRSYGTFPRVLREYVLGKKIVSMEEAVRKMTSLPAQRIGLSDRGLLAKGMAADVVVLDPAAIKDNATYSSPHQLPEGVRYVLVNGIMTVDDGKHTKERAGQVLRHRTNIA